MQNSSKKVVLGIINKDRPAHILDVPCGGGWLSEGFDYKASIDGIDLYSTNQSGYGSVYACDLNEGIPSDLPDYDCIACCEGIEHFGNPLLFFQTVRKHLNQNGLFIVTTPNTWYPASKLQFLTRGFFPSFPCIVGRIEPGSHMHIIPWSYPQLYLYLKLAGFGEIELHQEPLSQAKHYWEEILALPQRIYCGRKMKRAADPEERLFWKEAGSAKSTCGRHLIVTAKLKPEL